MAECRDRSGDWSETEVDIADWSEPGMDAGQETEESASDTDTPKPADIVRTRKLPANTSHQAQARRGTEKELKLLSNAVRLSEFPGELLERREGRLFCGACHVVLSEKKSSVLQHIRTRKHDQAREDRKKSNSRQQLYKEALVQRDEGRLVGETLPLDHRAYRMEVVETFLREGIPLAKVNGLRPLLERNAFSLTSHSHMAEYIPTILAEEKKRLKELIAGQPISIIFDGTTRLGEAIALVVRYVDHWTAKQVLVRLHTVAKPVSAAELTQFLNRTLAGEYQVDGENIIAIMRDGAAVNGAAVRNLSVLYPNLMDITCFSHTANNAGHHFEFATLHEFGSLWIKLFAHSAKAKLLWKQRTGAAVKTHSETRWWSKWEIYNQLLKSFGDVHPFLESADGTSPATIALLIAILDDEDDAVRLKLELAAMVDIGKHLVVATYKLEGDGPLFLSTYTTLQAIASAFATLRCPNLEAVATQITGEDGAEAATLVQGTIQKARPAINWFLRKFNVNLGATVAAFKAARIFDPVHAQSITINPQRIDALRAFPFFDHDDIIQDLQAELPMFVAAVDEVDVESDAEKLRWWSHQAATPCWQKAVRKMMLVQPSSAAAERVFSLLNSCFDGDQATSLEDYVEAAVMLRYNTRG